MKKITDNIYLEKKGSFLFKSHKMVAVTYYKSFNNHTNTNTGHYVAKEAIEKGFDLYDVRGFKFCFTSANRLVTIPYGINCVAKENSKIKTLQAFEAILVSSSMQFKGKKNIDTLEKVIKLRAMELFKQNVEVTEMNNNLVLWQQMGVL